MSQRHNEEYVMEREDTLIELGVASIETKGIGFLIADEVAKQNLPGLSDD